MVVLGLMVGIVSAAEAFTVTEHEFPAQYEVVVVEGVPTTHQFLLGQLADYPEMYEVSHDAPFVLQAELRALPGATTTPALGGIIVRVLDRGVEEVVRLEPGEAAWEKRRDAASGLAYLAGPGFSGEVPAGVYRIEVSTPDNQGQYILSLGTQPDEVGYLESLAAVGTLYDFYGAWTLGMIRSPLLYQPLLIILLLGGLAVTYLRTRHRLPLRRHA